MTTPSTPSARVSNWVIWLPLALFAGVAALALAALLRPQDTAVRSAMVGKPLPAFSLPAGLPKGPSAGTGLDSRALADGHVHVVNVFASWCLPCRVEAPQLAALRAAGVSLVGIAVRDEPGDLAKFLATNGNPFETIGRDDSGQVQLALGSSGVPESYIVDGHGVIRYQHIGEIRTEDMPGLLAQIREAGR
ncbi:DsbE family thiol:disulfide interchange protein [Novosphingobium sp. 9]|uniref:DsbE family thiol:disulfide interchange protein n=1 Tax=Novosphingobium sp. 9 TaxID=2025349 RepID=UPI0021B5278E|nr:DsbE family thiol:disulfide interchange protein [Novosphingobium sp. 9]